MAATPGEEVATPREEVATPTEELTTPTDKKSSKKTLVAGAVILGLLILVAGIGGIVYYVRKNDEAPIVDDDAVLVIDQETAAVAPNVTWPQCSGQIFVNQTAKKLYSIDVRINEDHSYGSMHVEVYDGVVGTSYPIARSSSKVGRGWTTFDFPTYRILQIPDHTYSFIIVPENEQTVATWYNDNANLEQGKRIVYDYTTHEVSDGPAGSSLTFKLYATEYDETPIVDDDAVLVIDEGTSVLTYDTYWPECQGQIFTNQMAKELYSIDVRIYDKYTYGSMHVELYDGLIDDSKLIAKSSSKVGQGWTSFDFPTHPILSIPDRLYTFLVVSDNEQDVAVWYNDGANLEQGKRIIYNVTTKEETDGPAGSSLTFKLYATEYDETPIVDDDVVLVIDERTSVLSYDTYWPECQGQIFVNQTAKELHSIDVRIYDKYTYGLMHVGLYDGLIGSGKLIAKSSSKVGQGWTSFDFPTRPILSVPDYIYTFLIVPDNKQDVAVWYNDGANLEQGKRIIYNLSTKEGTGGPAGSSLTFKLYATEYDEIPIVDDVPVLVIDQETAVNTNVPKWPQCEGQIFVNPVGKKLYSIDVRIGGDHSYGPMHVELDISAVDNVHYIVKSSSKDGQGWTSFDFPTHPILSIPDYTYIFIVVPDNKQDVVLWFNEDANLELGRRIIYDYKTKAILDGPAGSSLTFRLYATEYDEIPIVDDVPVLVIDQETAANVNAPMWPNCPGQIFVNPTGKKLYSIDVKIHDGEYSYDPMHVQLYYGLIGSDNLIAKSSTKVGEGWISFDFPTRPILNAPDYLYTFLIVSEDVQPVSVWYNDAANLEQGKRIVYNFTTKEETDGPAGSSLTFKLYATEYEEIPIVDNTPVLVIDNDLSTNIDSQEWPQCHGQIFTNERGKELYSIDVKFDTYVDWGQMHVELYDGMMGTNGYIAKSSTKGGKGWTSFDFPTHPILFSPDYTYTFLVVPDNKQKSGVWYTNNTNLIPDRKIVYNYSTSAISIGPSGSSLTYKLYATV